jgi:hypothetical protein
MTLAEVLPPDRGSLTVRYTCPACGYEMAMLTNPHETQVVTSLGVRIGREENQPGVDPGVNASAVGASSPTQGSACPFAAMVASAPGGGAAAQPGEGANSPPPETAVSPLSWTPQAEARLANIPAFVRPMARTGIERFARERGCEQVDETLLDAARAFFGM